MWSNLRIPAFTGFEGMYFEAPAYSDRWLYLDRIPTMIDGAGLSRLLRGYDEPLIESWGVGADTVMHFLTALAVLIYHSSPTLWNNDGRRAFVSGPSGEPFEKQMEFLFGLSRKGYLRLPRDYIIQNVARVRTEFAPDEITGYAIGAQLAEAFINAFLMKSPVDIDIAVGGGAPFLHDSTDENLYIDLLLLFDFLASILESAKNWYASQHGDRFVLDLKRWLSLQAPNVTIEAQRRVKLEKKGAYGDIDLLLFHNNRLIVVECKAYGKNREFMIGDPVAINKRRKRIAAAVNQVKRSTDAFEKQVRSGATEFPINLKIEWLVVCPSVEFLMPLNEHGMANDTTPRVVTPEELLQMLNQP